jgi:hypothetical protein
VAQSPSTEQLVLHELAEAQLKPPQSPFEPAGQLPLPSHAEAVVYETTPVLLTLHMAVPQVVPEGVLRHPLAPSHLPSEAQPLAEQVPATFGSWPFGMGEHVPSATPFLALAQEEQPPVHTLLQQKPSTHWPERHWVAVVQAWPLPSLFAHFPDEEQ